MDSRELLQMRLRNQLVLHFVAPSDLRTLLSLTGRRIITGAAGRNRHLGLDDDALGRARCAPLLRLTRTGDRA